MSQRSLQNSKAKPLSSSIHTGSCVISHRCEPRSLPLLSARWKWVWQVDKTQKMTSTIKLAAPQVAGTQAVDPVPFELPQASGVGCEARGLRMLSLSVQVPHPSKASAEADLSQVLLSCLLSSHRDREMLWVPGRHVSASTHCLLYVGGVSCRPDIAFH